MRFLFWIVLLGFAGFFFAGKGAEVKISEMVVGTLIGAVTGFLVALLFTMKKRDKNK